MGIAAFFGALMNMSFMLAGSASTNPVLFFLAVALILGWQVAGYYGADRFHPADHRRPGGPASSSSAAPSSRRRPTSRLARQRRHAAPPPPPATRRGHPHASAASPRPERREGRGDDGRRGHRAVC
ncbi:MAG: hypothetical protein U0232_29845 [Thermomicrobiales bacterium]